MQRGVPRQLSSPDLYQMVAMRTDQPLRRLFSRLRDLGYRLLTSRRRSLRQLFCPRRMPTPVFFTSFPRVIYFKRFAQATLDNVRLAQATFAPLGDD